jgi:hypothetical protein
MKSLNYQQVTEYIDQRLKIFDESRIVKNSSGFHKFNKNTIPDKIVDKKNILSIVDDEFIKKHNVDTNIIVEEIQKEIDVAKLAKFRKHDDFFLDNEKKPILDNNSKKENKGFFKSISNFFSDSKADKNTNKEMASIENLEIKDLGNEVIDNNSEIEIIKTQQEIDDEIKIKAEKLKLIEEEFRLKAEKREANEKSLITQNDLDSKKANIDFRKNKRKK